MRINDKRYAGGGKMRINRSTITGSFHSVPYRYAPGYHVYGLAWLRTPSVAHNSGNSRVLLQLSNAFPLSNRGGCM
jgi:hypothetical protein